VVDADRRLLAAVDERVPAAEVRLVHDEHAGRRGSRWTRKSSGRDRSPRTPAAAASAGKTRRRDARCRRQRGDVALGVDDRHARRREVVGREPIEAVRLLRLDADAVGEELRAGRGCS
jgi:hypothetical protein